MNWALCCRFGCVPGLIEKAVALRRRAWQRRRLHRVRASGRDEASSTADRVRELRPPSGLEGTAAGRARRGRRPVMRSTQGDATRRMSAAAERARKCAGSIRPVLVPQTMHARPATASRCASLAARLGERRSGVRRLSVLWARSWARRGSVRVSSVSLLSDGGGRRGALRDEPLQGWPTTGVSSGAQIRA